MTDAHAVKLCEIAKDNDCEKQTVSGYLSSSTNYLYVDGDGTSDISTYDSAVPSYNSAFVDKGKNKLIITVDQCKANKKLYFGA